MSHFCILIGWFNLVFAKLFYQWPIYKRGNFVLDICINWGVSPPPNKASRDVQLVIWKEHLSKFLISSQFDGIIVFLYHSSNPILFPKVTSFLQITNLGINCQIYSCSTELDDAPLTFIGSVFELGVGDSLKPSRYLNL